MKPGNFTGDLARSIGFLSRISLPQRYFAGHDGSLSRTVRAFPLAGVIIMLPPAILLAILSALDSAPLLSACLALALQVLITGALHEDGLSDAADGIGGGRERESTLAIMRDSRIGTYGAAALILSFALRASALSALMQHLPPLGILAAVCAVAALSRAAMVWHWSSLPPARTDGVAVSAGKPGTTAVTFALASGLGLAAGLAVLHLPLGASLLAIAATGLAVTAFGRTVERKIGGHTGDTIGATQQLSEIAALCALALAV